ncbi:MULTISPECIES: cation-transporting P-type ATPase [unclassified Streptomyces]|uniref:cation-translocating P-type ATPase n=1 Tax=unclassified Streptomyces TaxID=2593676 RepID=UPI002366AF66|nr:MULTISPECIES: cation-transporting P-type ATPase [unclassified Streptomyces]MDF3140306.1 cation-transporting P-type ATPase [Streptomyces sp. T21Q-yed]WDF44108.1 cation-transporting P-type ATPase [Streptomyces sp. T12]
MDGQTTTERVRAVPADESPFKVSDAHRLTAAQVAARLDVDPGVGLSARRATERGAECGPNRLAEPARRPEWLKFLDQFRNWLIGILLIAAVVAGAIGDVKDAVVITVVLQINAVLGYLQERRAERSLEALRRMLVPTARVRRDGTEQVVEADSLVPGDVVLLEAGDRVPADGRLTVAESVEVAEAALTGESQPVAKDVAAVGRAGEAEVPVAERAGMLFMNTAVTRGRAEMIVTATGMRTELGAIAEALRTGAEPPSPLQIQLDSLGRRLALLSGVAVVAYALTALVRGEGLADIALRAVALAVAAIPEGLPAVLALTLALGVYRMARRGAIVKRLASVESLGSATVVCSDKTGTLTLNEMTVRALWAAGRLYDVTGEGYGTAGTVQTFRSPDPGVPLEAVLPFALCNDARLTENGFIGDPTEAALVVLAAKAGMDADQLRTELPRIGELPFDAATKYMATFHAEPDGRTRVHVKGAVDVLLGLCADVRTEDGVRGLDDRQRSEILTVTSELGGAGLRVLGAATAVMDGPPPASTPAELPGLTLVSIAGIADPPRPQARDAIALCRTAGVAVKMITGDHADTAAAIAGELDIAGDVVTGAELDSMTEDQLAARIDDIGVFARVAPDHKVAIVRALASRGHIVAMTGDGVNDAAALRAAHIGVAMGVTGTDVAKEAADMVLTDDDFSTIVRAVREGRAIYDNIVKFVRFQLATNIGAILTLLGASLAGLPAPLTAAQLLWINIIMDGPPAMALAVDPARDDVMRHAPRDPAERILDARRVFAIVRAGAVMAAGTVTLLALARAQLGPDTALTMAFTTFVLFQLFNSLNARADDGPLLGRHQFRNRTLWLCLAGVLAIQVIAVHLPWARTVFGTVPLNAAQWAVCVGTASTVLLAELAVRAALSAMRRTGAPA